MVPVLGGLQRLRPLAVKVVWWLVRHCRKRRRGIVDVEGLVLVEVAREQCLDVIAGGQVVVKGVVQDHVMC